jgi:hypothetical protein
VNDQEIVITIIALTASLTAILVVRTIYCERTAGNGLPGRGRFTRPSMVRWLDFGGTVITVLLIASVITRVLNTVL